MRKCSTRLHPVGMLSHAGLIAAVALVALSGCARIDAPTRVPPTQPGQGAESPSAQMGPAGQQENLEVALACMQERGWSGRLESDGGIQYDGIPTSQTPQFDADSEECHRYADEAAPIPSAPRSEALLELNYQRVAAAHACLQENGYPVEPPPSYQEWRDRWESGSQFTVTELARTEELENGGTPLGQIASTCPDPDPFFYDVTTRIYPDAVDHDAYEAAT